MKTLLATLLTMAMFSAADAFAGIRGSGSRSKSYRVSRYDSRSLSNPYGAGGRHRTNGMMNPYSPYGSRYSNRSWRNPHATDAPMLYEAGRYRGRWSANRYAPDSTSNPYGPYGSRYSPDSVNNPYGAGSPYSTEPIYVWPSR
jgi:hypothetical protein